MRVKTPEISWHDTTPVYSCDFQPLIERSGEQQWSRLATCGRDNIIRLWRVPLASGQPEFLASLRRHDKPVNVVRFCPNGKDLLASGGDDGVVILWKRDVGPSAAAAASSRALFGQEGEEDEESSRETWQVRRVLRLHLEDVYDLSWSSTGDCLVSGSVDQSVIEWNLKSGQQLLLKDHKAYVQGVAWDPRDEYVLSLGSDRSCRVYRVGSRNCSYNVVRHEKERLFQDDSWKSFFRRLSYSPDGALLVCPSGCIGGEGHGAYVFTRQSLPSPVLALPTESRPAIAVRFCPTPFALPEGVTPLFGLPYVWVFCLVLEDGLLFYNTVSKHPIAYVGGIHYQALNDASWSSDGRLLVTCSTDGYCTVVHFEENELGRPSAEKANISAALALELGAETETEVGPRKRRSESGRKTEEKKLGGKAEEVEKKPGDKVEVEKNPGDKVEVEKKPADKVEVEKKPADKVEVEKKPGHKEEVEKEGKALEVKEKVMVKTDMKTKKNEEKGPLKPAIRISQGESCSSKVGLKVKFAEEEPIGTAEVQQKKAARRSGDDGTKQKKVKSKEASKVQEKKVEAKVTPEVKKNVEVRSSGADGTKQKKEKTKATSEVQEKKVEAKVTPEMKKNVEVRASEDKTKQKKAEAKTAAPDLGAKQAVAVPAAEPQVSVSRSPPREKPPAAKKRRVTFVTLSDATGASERSEAAPAPATDGSGESSPGEAPRKRRVTITTLSCQPGGPSGGSPLQPMKRRVPLTTLSHSVSPDDTADNLSNMSVPEFQLHLEDSNPGKSGDEASNQLPQ